jgi:hypothetical protein
MSLEQIYPNADYEILDRFNSAMTQLINSFTQLNIINSINSGDYSFILKILRRSNISSDILLKHSEERNAIGRILLIKLKEFESLLEGNMKYPTIEQFQTVYHGKLCQELITIDRKELNNLWKTANWTNILLNLLLAAKKAKKTPKKGVSQQATIELSQAAKGNKGLVLHVVPRVVEGPSCGKSC